MCAQCVSKADCIVGTIGFAAFCFKGPITDSLIAAGVLPEPHPLALEVRTVNFLRDLDLDPAPIVGDEVVDAVDRVQAFPLQKVYRRSFRDALALLWPTAMRSQMVFATK
jgi:hypothetical protein